MKVVVIDRKTNEVKGFFGGITKITQDDGFFLLDTEEDSQLKACYSFDLYKFEAFGEDE
jgi:hypothetical protein